MVYCDYSIKTAYSIQLTLSSEFLSQAATKKTTADASLLLPENLGVNRHVTRLIAAALVYPGAVSINSVALAGSLKSPRIHAHIFPAIDGVPAHLGSGDIACYFSIDSF